jgi:hypothetical protein
MHHCELFQRIWQCCRRMARRSPPMENQERPSRRWINLFSERAMSVSHPALLQLIEYICHLRIGMIGNAPSLPTAPLYKLAVNCVLRAGVGTCRLPTRRRRVVEYKVSSRVYSNLGMRMEENFWEFDGELVCVNDAYTARQFPIGQVLALPSCQLHHEIRRRRPTR